MITTPLAGAIMMPRKINNYAYETVPQKGLNGRKGYQPRGMTLGGSSAINAMVYIRGHRWDYDHWAALGNPGWSYDDVLPYFKKSENNEAISDAFHGKGGPLNVAEPVSYTHLDVYKRQLQQRAAQQTQCAAVRLLLVVDQDGGDAQDARQKQHAQRPGPERHEFARHPRPVGNHGRA